MNSASASRRTTVNVDGFCLFYFSILNSSRNGLLVYLDFGSSILFAFWGSSLFKRKECNFGSIPIIAILNDIHKDDTKFILVYIEPRIINSQWNNLSNLILHIFSLFLCILITNFYSTIVIQVYIRQDSTRSSDQTSYINSWQ